MKDPFFIIGNSRSGTTLIARILKRNTKIHVLNETHFFEEFTNKIKSFEEIDRDDVYRMVNLMLTIQRKDYFRKSEYQEYPEAKKIVADYDQLKHQGFSVLNKIFFYHEAKRYGKNRAGDQTPRNVFYVDEIFSMYPGAKVIHMIRDPRAVLFSQKRKWEAGLRRNQPLYEIIRTFFNYHPVTMSILWNKAVTRGLKAEKRYGKRKVKTLKFEEFVHDPYFHTKKICQFLGEDFQPAMMDVTVELSAISSHEGKKGVSEIVAQQWINRLGSADIFFCEKISGKLMNKLGYPLSRKNPNWITILGYIIWMPFHLGVAVLMNLRRIGNPTKYMGK